MITKVLVLNKCIHVVIYCIYLYTVYVRVKCNSKSNNNTFTGQVKIGLNGKTFTPAKIIFIVPFMNGLLCGRHFFERKVSKQTLWVLPDILHFCSRLQPNRGIYCSCLSTIKQKRMIDIFYIYVIKKARNIMLTDD